jgi:hypothetical protein
MPRPRERRVPSERICGLMLPRRYNSRVSSPEQHNHPEQKHPRHAVYASETTGLLLIAILLLMLTLIRYWHEIHWSLR